VVSAPLNHRLIYVYRIPDCSVYIILCGLILNFFVDGFFLIVDAQFSTFNS
jgi:hypothetical protein